MGTNVVSESVGGATVNAAVSATLRIEQGLLSDSAHCRHSVLKCQHYLPCDHCLPPTLWLPWRLVHLAVPAPRKVCAVAANCRPESSVPTTMRVDVYAVASYVQTSIMEVAATQSQPVLELGPSEARSGQCYFDAVDVAKPGPTGSSDWIYRGAQT